MKKFVRALDVAESCTGMDMIVGNVQIAIIQKKIDIK